MKSWSDRLGDALDSLSAEEKARLDREYRALVESREPIPGDDQWLDEGPDPFGMDWAWCDGPFDGTSDRPRSKPIPANVTASIGHSPAQRHSANARRMLRYSAAGLAAASLMITMSYLIDRPTWWIWNPPLLASATPVALAVRGGEGSLGLEVHSNGTGFVSVISLGPGRSPIVCPLPGGVDIPIRPGTPAGVGPLPPDTASVVFAVTESPASESIVAELGARSYSPEQSAELVAFLGARLKAIGFRRAAVGSRAVAAPTPGADRR